MGKKKKGSIYLDIASNSDNSKNTISTETDNLRQSLNKPNIPEVNIPEVAKEITKEKKQTKLSKEMKLVKEPAVVVEPDVVVEPEVVKETEVTKEPEVVVEPEVTKEPEVVVESEVTKELYVAKEPDVTKEPEVVVKSDVVVEPQVTKETGIDKETDVVKETEVQEDKFNENTKNVDFTENLFNGYYSYAIASETIIVFQCVEVLLNNGILMVRPTIPSSKNSFFGIAQNDGDAGQKIKVLTGGVSKLRLRKNINLPAITKINGQLTPIRDKIGKIITQSISIPINKNDILVLAGTNSDILVGPSTQFYQYNAIGNEGLLTVYKSIQINTNNITYNINYTEQNIALGLKSTQNRRFVQVLDINNETGEIIGYL